jgi:hypothetical protein
MRRATRVTLIAAGVAIAVFFASAGVAWADDCSTPADCANTAWTVGGAAAAAAAVAGAAAAAGWLPGGETNGLPEGRDGSRLSRECFIDLQLLSTPIKATIQQISELTVAVSGAARMWIDAQNRAAAARYRASQLAGGTTAAPVAASRAANASSAIGESATLGVHHATTAASAAQRTSAGLSRAASQFGQMGEAAEAARAAGHATTYADEATRLAGIGGRVGHLVTGLGVANIAAELYGQISYQSTEDRLWQAGQLATQSDMARIEARRWKAFMEHTQRRIDALKPTLLAQVRAYNARAEECNAVPLSEDLDAFSRATQGAAGAQPSAAGEEIAPASILRRAPEPLPERDPMYTNCDPAFYQQEMALFKNDLRDWQRRSDLWVRWRQRETDLEITANAARLEVNRLEYQLKADLGNMRALGTISGGTAAAAMMPCFTPVGQLIFGGVSLLTGMAETYLSPSAWQAVILGKVEAQISWLQNQLGYSVSEQNRLRTHLNSLETNLRARRGSLRSSYRACKGAELGWEPVPDLPDFYSPYQRQPGHIRSVKDFAKWP